MKEPESIVSNFISSFVTDLLSSNMDSASKMFMTEPALSVFTHVTKDGEAIFAHQGPQIVAILATVSELFANSSAAEVTHVSATEVVNGVHGTALLEVATPEVSYVVQFVVLLEKFADDGYFVRSLTFTILRADAVVVEVAPVEEVEVPQPEPVVEEAAPEVVEEVAVVPEVVVEEPVVKPKKGKGKGKKAEEAAPAAAPVEEVAVEEAAAVVEEAPVVEETPAPAPKAPEAPTGPKSWATLAASKPAAAPAKSVVRVAPPTKEEPAAVAEAAPAPKKAARAAPRAEANGDKLVFTTNTPVTDEQVQAALGKWAKSIASLRNVSAKHHRVFVDFSVEGVLDDLKGQITIAGHKVPVFHQKTKSDN